MNPSARIKSSIELLEKIESSPIPMDATMGDYMRNRRYIGSKDRANIAERVYNIVRAHARISWWLAQAGERSTPMTRMLAWLSLGEVRNPDNVKALYDGSKYGPRRLNQGEETLVDKLCGHDLTHDDMPDSVIAECPAECEQALRELYADRFKDELVAMIEGASLDLRVNLTKTTREAAQASLAADDIQTMPTPYSPWGLRVDGKVFLSKAKAFKKGEVEIQDEGSQLIAYMCGAETGQQVMDYCAGAGGKTLALASMMGNKGRIIAMDVEKSRLDKARKRFRRAGVNDMIEPRPIDDKNKKWLRRQKEHFDVVLADVPCSGSGTWRRNPDTRWVQYGPSLEELKNVQADILERTAKLVKPGGHLVYATCSLFPEENERQIEYFLATHPDFALVPLTDFWQGTPPCDGPYMRLSPLQSGTDGFFAARLTRKAA